MKIYGILGYPLEHSFSKDYFNNKFKEEGIDAQYKNLEIPHISDLKKVLNDHPTLVGFNVTSPFKEQIIPYLDRIEAEAKEIQAINCVKVERDSNNKAILIGRNADMYGFVDSIQEELSSDHQKALVLGTGGAAKAAVYGLKSIGVQPQLVSRVKTSQTITYNDLTQEVMDAYKLIVNCTPLGMLPDTNTKAPLPYHRLNSSHFLYDMIYNPEVTAFLAEGVKRGCKTKNGYDMLIQQAIKSWEIWTER